MATLIHADGSEREIKDVHLLSYDRLRELLDGPVEYVYFTDGRVLLVNELFKFRDFPLNLRATTLIDGHYDKIHGPAILMSAGEFKTIEESPSSEQTDD